MSSVVNACLLFSCLLYLFLGCSTLNQDRNTRYIYHPYEFESCRSGERCVLIKGVYTIERGIHLLDKMDIDFDGSGSTIIMSGKAPVRNGYCLINLRDCANLSFKNLNLYGSRQERKCAESYAHSLIIVGSENINVRNVNIFDSVADAIFIAAGTEGDSSTYSRQIRIQNVSIDGSCRNGISIINAYDVVISHCVINNSNGLSPAAGIDVESDTENPKPSNKNITIESCSFSGHGGCGIMTSQKGVPQNINISDNTIDHCKIGVFISSKLTNVENNVINNCELYGIQSIRYDNYPIDGNYIARNKISSADVGIHYCGEGGIIKNNQVEMCKKAGIWLNGNTIHSTKASIESNVIVQAEEYGIYANNFGITDIKFNRITNAKKEGISIMNGISLVDSNMIQLSTTGAVMTGSKGQFNNNEVMDCETGIQIIGGGKYKPEGILKRNKFIRVQKSWSGEISRFQMEGNNDIK